VVDPGWEVVSMGTGRLVGWSISLSICSAGGTGALLSESLCASAAAAKPRATANDKRMIPALRIGPLPAI
jgi:hypothetical protein